MKINRAGFGALLLSVAFPLTAAAQQTPSATAQAAKLAYLVGTWHGESTGDSWDWTVTRGPAGAFHGEGVGVDGGTPFQIDEILGFDGTTGEYVWVRFPSGEAVQRGRGWLKEDTWTFLFDDAPQNGQATRVRCTITMVRADHLALQWARSIEGGAWEVTYDGTATKRQ